MEWNCGNMLGGSQGKGIRIEIRIEFVFDILWAICTVNLLWKFELLGIAWIMVFRIASNSIRIANRLIHNTYNI